MQRGRLEHRSGLLDDALVEQAGGSGQHLTKTVGWYSLFLNNFPRGDYRLTAPGHAPPSQYTKYINLLKLI